MFINHKKLFNDGYLIIDGSCKPKALIELASQFGEIIRHPNNELINILRPRSGKNSKRGSFSYNFGLGEFPMHTDTAFWGTPARYLILAMSNQSITSTTLIKFSDVLSKMPSELSKKVTNTIYLLKTYEGSRYLGVQFNRNGKVGYRFDPNIMIPKNSIAKLFHESFKMTLSNLSPIEVKWCGERILIIDNWNLLHGRCAVSNVDTYRELIRLYVR